MRSIKINSIITVLFLIASSLAYSQANIDSLESANSKATGEEKLKLLIRLGQEYAKTNPDKALDYGLQALVQAKRQSKELYESNALWLLGKTNFSLGKLDNAFRYLNRSLSLFEKLNRKDEQVEVLIDLAKLYDSAKNPEMALQFLNKAKEISIQNRNKKLQIETLLNLGQIFIKQENYKQAFYQFLKILDLLGNGKLSNDEILTKILCYNKIGLAYKNLGDFDKSLVAYKQATLAALQLGDSSEFVINLREIGLSFYLLQQMDSSLIYYTNAFNASKKLSDSLGMMYSLGGLGDVYFETKKFQQAMNSFNRQLELAQTIKDDQGIVTALVKISRCYYITGDYPVSTSYLNRALAFAKQKNLLSSAADVYQYLSLISEAEGRYKDALNFHKLWADLRDSIYNEESGEKMAKLQILYDINQKERENEILRQSSEIQSLQLTKNSYQRIILIAVAVSFFVLVIFLLLLYQSKRKEFRKQKETEQKIVEINKELERRMVQEIKKQEKQQHLLAHKSKLESLGTLAAGLAHEINQPLGGISMGLDNILLKLDDRNISESYIREKVKLLFDNVDRIKRIIDHVRIFSRTQKPIAFEPVNLNEIISNALQMVGNQYQNQGIVIETELTQNPCTIIGDKYKLEQVVLNLLSNARYAVDEKEKKSADSSYQKRIEIKTWVNEFNACFSVYDNGIGIYPENLEKIFDPFFTTKSEDKGTGLGLSIAYGFIKDILGEIRVDSEEGEFSFFEVIIPKN